MRIHLCETRRAEAVLQFTLVLFLGLLVTFFLLPRPVLADTVTVDTLVDESDGDCGDGDCSLRDAIATADPDDEIDFGVTGIITLTLGQLTVDKDLTISGPGETDLIISGAGNTRVFWINDSISTTLSELTIADGRTDNQDGGGIFNRGGILTVDSCTLSNNSARYDGGGICNRFDGTLNVYDSTFLDNTSRNGGGIDNRETLKVYDSTFEGNSCSTWGGGIYNYKGNAIVEGSSFADNGEYTDAGGGICNHEGTLEVNDSEFSGNNADGSAGGGGIYNEDQLSVTDCDFLRNTATRGGGISNVETLTVTKGIFSNNSVDAHGGGILSTDALIIFDSTFYSNTAEWGGGIENTGLLEIDRTTFFSNIAQETGGGICSHDTLTVTNSTFYANTAGVRGGGINNNEGTLYATNCTFVDNAAGESGSGVRNEMTATLVNIIMANDSTGGNCAGEPLEAASTNGLSTDVSCTPGFSQTTEVALGLDWQGWVFELITGSVAIDAGTNVGCPDVDQLGQARPQDGDGDEVAICDVGAYEFPGSRKKYYLPSIMNN